MSNDMHPDLKWLAEVCEEWLGSFESLGVQDGEPCWGYSVTSACPYTKPQWLQARKDLGLVMTEEEQELPAEEWNNDPVNRPAHYQADNGIECIDAIRAALGLEGFVAHCRGTAIKYAWRSGKKAAHAEDLRKGAWYLTKAAEELEASALRAKELEG